MSCYHAFVLFLMVLIVGFLHHVSAIDQSISLNGLSFSPSTVNIAVGDRITWTWVNGQHTVTSGTVSDGVGYPDGSFCSNGGIPDTTSCSGTDYATNNVIYIHTFTKPGTYPYYCAVHAQYGMTGTIVVQDTTTNIPPTTETPTTPAPTTETPTTKTPTTQTPTTETPTTVTPTTQTPSTKAPTATPTTTAPTTATPTTSIPTKGTTTTAPTTETPTTASPTTSAPTTEIPTTDTPTTPPPTTETPTTDTPTTSAPTTETPTTATPATSSPTTTPVPSITSSSTSQGFDASSSSTGVGVRGAGDTPNNVRTSSSSSVSSGALIGIIVGSICGGILLLVLCLFGYRTYVHKQREQDAKDAALTKSYFASNAPNTPLVGSTYNTAQNAFEDAPVVKMYNDVVPPTKPTTTSTQFTSPPTTTRSNAPDGEQGINMHQDEHRVNVYE